MLVSSPHLTYELQPGKPSPLGATPDKHGVNFAIFSEHATGVQLLVFDNHDDLEPVLTFNFDPAVNHTGGFWHLYVKGLKAGYHYAYRVDGPHDLSAGHRFNRHKVLIDPYSKGTTNSLWKRAEACHAKDNLKSSMRSVIIDPEGYDWEQSRPPGHRLEDAIVYELHVGQFTKAASSKVKHPGTFAGVVEKIPYLKDLGVTVVELMPVCDFDDTEVIRTLPDGTELKNSWGYSTVSYFAPHSGYCVSPHVGQHLNEFRNMVKAFHAAGIEVVLDVVFNHTSEGNHQGPMMHFKGMDNSVYYYLVSHNKRYYMDYSGCGNSMNANHPMVQKLVMDSLTYWVKECQVDGFRFDEGSIFSRGDNGAPLPYPPLLWNIDLSDTFANTKLFAEAWDAGGLNEVGSFPGYRWSQWNGYFRDTVRDFAKGTPGVIAHVAARIAGSADLYQNNHRGPLNSLNYVTCHDGFTMMDYVSYNEKHNEGNGENNQDGINDNRSWNCGAEGGTEDAGIVRLRHQIMKNAFALLLLSRGVPMILMGDEVGRTQLGNNNAYCQDGSNVWFDWTLTEKNKDIYTFVKKMIALRKQCSALRSQDFYQGKVNNRGLKDIDWHGCELHSPGWDDGSTTVLAFTIAAFAPKEPDLFVVCNMGHRENRFAVPPVKKRRWHLYARTDIDTYGPDPITGGVVTVPGRTVMVFTSKPHTA